MNLQWLTEKYPQKKGPLTVCVYLVTALLGLQVLALIVTFFRQLIGLFQSSAPELQPLASTLFHTLVAGVLLFGALIFITGGRDNGRGKG